jgi:crotonobetainyl-CoA:carnitine CoA-transferase CaiB-like acyl-CoA transferase
MVAPLEGVLVLDLTRLLPGPFATQLLRNLGAEVIKVEEPLVGDYMRAVPPTVRGTSYPFLMVNRGKRSLAVDLKRPEGQEILHRLASRADVFVEQFRPGVTTRLGADYETLGGLNPRLVYCSFSGYGQTGPLRDLPGHDITFQAHAGILGVTADRSGKPVVPGVPIADLASGFNAALSILAALRTRDRTGRGEFIDVSIFDTALALTLLNLAHFLASGEEPWAGETMLTGVFPFYALYETQDNRWMAVGAVEPKFWTRLCEILGVSEFAERQFDKDETGELARILAERFRTRSQREWEALFLEEGLPVAAVRRVSEVAEDPQVQARGLLPSVTVPGLGPMQVVAHPARHSVSVVENPGGVPPKGGDTELILRGLGYSLEDIESLDRAGVISR